jgi:hypothetical protein
MHAAHAGDHAHPHRRGTLVAGACLLAGAPRKVVCAGGGAGAHRVVRSEVVSLDQWYKRSLRFRSAGAAPPPGQHGAAPGAGAGGAPASSGGASSSAATGAAAAGAAAGAYKRPAAWAPDDARAGADQRRAPAAAAAAAAAAQQQQQQAPRQPRPPGAGAPPPPAAAGARAGAPPQQQEAQQQQQQKQQQQQQHQPRPRPAMFTPEQLQAKTAKELEALLRARGQPAGGRKDALVARLLDWQRRLRRAMRPAA